MSIPKVIYQTFKSSELPFVTKWHIKKFRKKNPDYQYEFYDDKRIDKFLAAEFNDEVVQAYRKIQIGAAKADFFRYAILYRKGGIYLDIDSRIVGKLDDFILPQDTAVVSLEKNPGLYVQWALIYEANHPFLGNTLKMVLENINQNKYPHNVHSMTGPYVYSQAITECLKNNPATPYRLLGVDYNGHIAFKYPLNKLLYKKGEHWKKEQKVKTVLRANG